MQKTHPKSYGMKPRTQEPPHGKITGYYVVVYDRHIGREIIIPATRMDILKGTVRLP